jgi:hypothetical protein
MISNGSKQEYLLAIRSRYLTANKLEKQAILDEFCAVCGYNRKYAIRVLRRHPQPKSPSPKTQRGRKKKYHLPELIEFLKAMWIAANLACGKRLKAMIPNWLPHSLQPLTDEIKSLLTTISASTIDRLLKPQRAKYQKSGLSTTKPGSILKHHIPIKTNQWDESQPGFLEIDTVAHCGTSGEGMFVFTVNCVDIATSWTEQRAIWGKGERGVIEAVKSIELALPFPLLGFDCDNGSEFLNWHLYRYLTQRQKPVQYTRSRPYHKNDNAHVEGKNWTHVRQYLGYSRFDRQELTSLLNDLYTSQAWRGLLNFFLPSVKLQEKSRQGAKIIRKHDSPKTPLQRVLQSPHVSEQTKQKLREQFQRLNPFELQQQIREKIKPIHTQVSAAAAAADTTPSPKP